MKDGELKFLIEKSKLVNINDINCSNEECTVILRQVYEFIQNLYENYDELISKLNNSNVRFSDYYDTTMLHGEEILEYFKNTYNRSDIEEATEVFSLYVVLKNALELVSMNELCGSMDELYHVMNNNTYFEDVLLNINYLEEQRLLREENKSLEFLDDNNKYKVYFTGLSYKDILKLEKNVKKAFINKISGQLIKSDIIPLVEEVDHVKRAYNLSLFRVQFANDYRITYVRRNGVTAILGVTIKSGKDADYSRYDYIAKNKEKLFEEIDNFALGNVSMNSDHNLVIEHLEEFYKKVK